MSDIHESYAPLIDNCEGVVRTFRRFLIAERIIAGLLVVVAVAAAVGGAYPTSAVAAFVAVIWGLGSLHSARLIREWSERADGYRREGRRYAVVATEMEALRRRVGRAQ